MTPPAHRPRVLLAEDNVDHAFFATRAFRDAQGGELEMDTVTDGEQVLDYLYQREGFVHVARPHLIVLDLKMPKMGGLEVLAEIADDADLRAIPVVVLSSSDRPEDIQESYALGANSFVTKPATASGLHDGLIALARYWMDIASLPEPA
jgi:CheY-like chemotaxis protein